jgi:outer membrane protein
MLVRLLSFSGIAVLLIAQPPERLTLEQARELAVANHPAIAAQRFSAEAAAERPVQTGAARYPTVTGNFTGAGAPENTRLAAGNLNNPVIYSRVATGLSVNQLLFDFGRTSKLMRSERTASVAAEVEVDVARQNVLLEVDRSYFAALRAGALVKVAEATVTARQVVVDQIRELARARMKSGLDLSFAEVGLEEAKLLVASALNEKKAAHADLAAAMGFPATQHFELVDQKAQIEPLALSDLVPAALQKRPDLQARALEAEAAKQFVEAERASKWPTVSAIASAGWIPERDAALRGSYSAAGLTINLPFLNGGLFRSREREAEQRARAAAEREKSVRLQIVREVNNAFLNVNTAAERVDLSARLLEHARQAMDLAQSRYDLGLSSIVELSQAQLAVTSAAIQNVNASYDYQLQRAILANRIGEP